MPKEYFPTTDQFPTITVYLSAPDTLAATTWRGTIPLGLLALDGRAHQSAIISAVLAARFGGAAVPEGVSLRLLANAHGADYAAGFDARQTPLGSIGFEVAFGSEFAGMTDVPLSFTVAGHAGDGPALEDVELPTIAANTTDLTLKDGQGGELPGYAFQEIATGSGGSGEGDAATLQGHPASYFATAAHTHSAAAITDFNEAVQDAVAAALVAGSGQAITYDDASNTITFVNSAPLTTESVQDIVGAMVEAGSNVATSYDDATGKLTITASGGEGGGFTQEQIEDMVAGLLVAGSNVTLNYNDATGELEIVAAGSGGDADTLQGFNGAHYKNADNHTDGTTNKVFTAAEKTKLSGIASGATANAKATDAEVIAGTENTKFITPAQAKLAAETHGAGGGEPAGTQEVQTVSLSNYDAMEGIRLGYTYDDSYNLMAAYDSGSGTLLNATIQTALNAFPQFVGNPVGVSGTINSDEFGLMSGSLVLTWDNPGPQDLIKLWNEMLMAEITNNPPYVSVVETTPGSGESSAIAIEDVTGLQDALDDKAAVSHTHSIASITGLQTELDGLQAAIEGGGIRVVGAGTEAANGDYLPDGTELNGQPVYRKDATWVMEFKSYWGTDTWVIGNPYGQYYRDTAETGPPTVGAWLRISEWGAELPAPSVSDASAVAIADVTGLQSALDGKADDAHTHAIANITGLQTELDALEDAIEALAPAGSGYQVAGSGDPAYDGLYLEDGAFLGKPAYTNGSKWLYWGDADFDGIGDGWLIADSKVDADFAVYSGGTTESPLGTWGLSGGPMSDGKDPAPSVTAVSGESIGIEDVTGLQDALDAKADVVPEAFCVPVSDEVTTLITGTSRMTFRMPFAMTLSAVRASLTTASSSGLVTFDINQNGASILSTKLSIDASEKTSTTAATPAVISNATLGDDAEITIDIDAAGTGAAGGKVYLIGVKA